MFRRARAAGDCVVATAFAVLGCGKILGIDEYTAAPGGEGPKDAAPAVADAAPRYPSKWFRFSFATSECAACSDDNCRDKELACASDPDCNAWAKCRAACSDAKCIAGCP